MSGSTNFQQFNPTLTNMETDATYNADTMRENGVSGGVASSSMHNKLFYQISAMVAAFAQMLAAKGFTVNDGSAGVAGNDFNQLVSVLSHIMTDADAIAAATAATATSLSMVGEASAVAGGPSVTLDLGSVKAGDRIIVQSCHSISTDGTGEGYFQIDQVGGTAGIVIGGSHTSVHSTPWTQPSFTDDARAGAGMFTLIQVFSNGTLTLRAVAIQTVATFTVNNSEIYVSFLKKG